MTYSYNPDMPNRRTDRLAYEQERKRRIREGTWVSRGMEHGHKQMSLYCKCDLCRVYQRGYKAGNRAREESALYADDPYMKELLP